MKNKKAILFVTILFVTINLFSQKADKEKNVVIESAKDEFTFVYNKKMNRVEVQEKQYVKYKTLNTAAKISVGETYSDNISIDNIAVKVDGDKAKWIVPKYEYLSQDDIFFSDQHICFFDVDLYKKESNAEVVFEKTYTDPKYFCQVYFDEPYDVQNKEIKITIPRWMRADFKEFNFEGNHITKSVTYDKREDADVYSYTASNYKSSKKERHCPGPTYYLPHLLALIKSATTPNGENITYFNTTADQYAWYRQVVQGIDNDMVAIKAKATEITKDASNDLDKIKAIFYWVQNNIRYLAFEDGIAGFKPDKAHEVLRKKYGDCKGMAHLTKALLISLGYDARLCWIGTNHIAYDYSTPSLSVDNHMICALVHHGKTYFLDATEKYIGFNEYAERIQGRQTLYENGDKYVLENVPTTSYQQNKDYEKRVLTIDGTDLKGTVSQEWHGEEKEYLLSQLNNIKKENVKESFQKYLTGNNNDYAISDLVTSDLNNYDKAVTAKYNLLHKNALSSFGKELYLDVDFRKDFGNFTIDTAERKLDYWHYFKFNVFQETEVNLPVGAKIISMPQNILIKNDDYEIDITYTQQPNKLFYKKSIIVKNPKLSKAKFNQWNADFKKLKDFYSEQVIIAIN
ncbi:MAG: transglutaminase-like domain-containing protein [Chitinophagaceae bacterium]